MGALKEFYDLEVYLPEEPSNQLELVGLVNLFGGALEGFKVVEADECTPEIPTPIKPLQLNSGWLRL